MIQIKHVLYPTDFSDPSLHAARYAQAFADAHKAQIHVLHVVYPYHLITDVDGMADDPLPVDLLPALSQRLASFCKEHLTSEAPVIQNTVVGQPFYEIVRYAKEHQIDLIVLGTHGRGALSHLLIGSVAEKVVRKAPCPVLTVRHPEHDFVMP